MHFQKPNPLSIPLALTLLVGLLALPACAATPGAPPGIAAVSTPIPAYIATDQSAALQARATIQAAEAQAYNLSLTGTSVAVEVGVQSTLVALQLTGSAATEQYTIRQTQAAGEATATSISLAATRQAGTAQAAATAVAQAATATQSAADNFVRATATQLALNEMERRDRSQQQSLLFRTWAGRIALVLLFAFGLLLAWRLTPWLCLKFFGVHAWQGKPILLIPDKNRGFHIVDIARSLGPGLTLDDDGRPITTGLAPDLEMQNAVTARAQAAELLLAAGDEPGPTRRRVLRQASGLATPPALPGPPGEIVNTQFRVLPPDDPQVSAWLHDVEGHLLEDPED
ncbi:MAG: hypothetical protein ACOYYS_08750 [Chloroflexota bacterium]